MVDVVGASATEDDAAEVPVREQALDFLNERNESWFTTAEVRETCDLVSRSQVLKVLKELRDEGRIVSRNAAGRNWEWKAA